MKIKRGFTLSETIVTLAIIGVIAVVILPIIKDTQPNQEMILVKKSYYNICRVVSELINDEDFYPDREGEEARSGFSNVSIQDMIGSESTYHGFTFVGASKFCGLFASKLNTIQSGDPNNLCESRVGLDAGGNFSTPDGVTWSMPVSNFASGNEMILVDVNGPRRGANCAPADSGFAGAGMNPCGSGTAPDRFAFRVERFGAVSIPSRITQLYTTSTQVNKKYQDFVRENPGIQ